MAQVEDILAVTFLFGGGTLAAIAYSPIGRAVADRLRHGKAAPAAPQLDPAVYEELDHLRADVSELQERLDFAERLLAKPVDAEKAN